MSTIAIRETKIAFFDLKKKKTWCLSFFENLMEIDDQSNNFVIFTVSTVES